MKIKWNLLISLTSLLVICGGCQKSTEESLTVIIGKEYVYQCTDGSLVTARFGKLSDKSLNFVKIKMDSEKEYTLPQLISASGARYSDEHSLEFWSKGDRVTISKMDENGEWNVEKEGETKTK